MQRGLIELHIFIWVGLSKNNSCGYPVSSCLFLRDKKERTRANAERDVHRLPIPEPQISLVDLARRSRSDSEAQGMTWGMETGEKEMYGKGRVG